LILKNGVIFAKIVQKNLTSMVYRRFLFLLFICLCSRLLPAQIHYTIEKLGSKINTSSDEITPIIDWDGKVMYFTRVGYPDFNKSLTMWGEDQNKVMTADEYNRTLREVYSKIAETFVLDPARSSYNQDVWIANSENSEFDKVIHPGAPINNALPNSISSMAPELRTFIVINQFIPDGGMDIGFSIVQQLNDTTWSFPQPLNIQNYYTYQSSTSLSMSSDGEVIALSLSRLDSQGDTDLYVCFKQNDSTWSAPQNLGKGINTKFREATPHLSADMKRLYFSSNRTGTLGGMDLYYAERLDSTWANWSEVRQFVYPINSKFDDSQPQFNAATGQFYFTSKREGSSDIYRVQTAPPMPMTVTIKGKITNGKTNEPIEADILFGELKEKYYQSIDFSKDGEFTINIPKGEEYKIMAQKSGFIGHPTTVKIEKYKNHPNGFRLDLILDPIEEEGKITLNNLYFKQSESVILEKSFPELENLADILQENKDLYIRIEGHTDNTGKAEELKALSERRAQAVKDFLITQKIKADRVQTIGFGGEKPIFETPKNEEQRQKNRRVEVKITKKKS
jgi:OmpA-OmpF porin, OOP family